MQHTIKRVSLVSAAVMLATANVAVAQSNQRDAQNPSRNSQQNRSQTDRPQADRVQSRTEQPATAQTGNTSTSNASRSEQYIDYRVINQESQAFGTVEIVWDDAGGEPLYLGIKQPQQDKLAIVPADRAQVNHATKTIRLNLSAPDLQKAPTIEADAELKQETREQALIMFAGNEQQSQSKERSAQSAAEGKLEQQDEATIRLRQEQATVGKRMIDAGGVVLRKVVRTETNREPVTLRREELVIERIPGGGERAANARLGEDEIFIPLRREVPVVQKDTVLKETVRVGKEVQAQQTNVTTTVREEQLRIQRQGQASGTGGAGGTSTGSGTGDSSSGQSPSQPQSEENSSDNQEEK